MACPNGLHICSYCLGSHGSVSAYGGPSGLRYTVSHVTLITTSVQHGFPLAKHDLTPTHLTQTQEQVPCLPIFSSEPLKCCSVPGTSHQTRSSTNVLTKSPTSEDVVLILGVGSRASYLQWRGQASRSLKSAICMKQTS